jgi:hypothetical protein
MIIGFSFRSLMLAGVVGIGFAVPSVAEAACTGGSTLIGYYGMQVSGETLSGVGKFLNGVIYFNGSCALQANATIGENGTVNSFVTWLGTYSTNPDNTITLNWTLPGESAPETYTVAFSPVFNEALGTETDASAVASIDFKAQNYPASGNHNIYGNAQLKGTFAATCTGTNLPFGETNYISFDGTTAHGGYGAVTGTNYSNDDAVSSSAPISGLYGVNSIGNFGGYVVVGPTTAGFSGVLDNDLNEIQYTLSTAGSTGLDVEACVAKRIK